MKVLEVCQNHFHQFLLFFILSNWMETFCSSNMYLENWKKLKKPHAQKYGGLIIIILKSPKTFPSSRTGWQGTAAVFISVGAARAATQCRLFGPELSVFLLWQMGTCEENMVQLRPNFRVTIAVALWPWGEADSQGGALWVMLFAHVWKRTCGNTHGQLT